jgi:putative FmdB family regulatory protein
MPIFEYQCTDCLTTFERLMRRTENGVTPVCPQCNGDNTSKRFSTFSTQSGGLASTLASAPPAFT